MNWLACHHFKIISNKLFVTKPYKPQKFGGAARVKFFFMELQAKLEEIRHVLRVLLETEGSRCTVQRLGRSYLVNCESQVDLKV